MGVRPVNLRDVKIGFKNFEGREGAYNKNGERSFAVFLDHDLAETLLQEGWNVKFPKENSSIDPDDDIRNPHLQISVGFEYYPPKVVLISNGKPTVLGEEEVTMLDWAELEKVDLIIRPYSYTVSGKTGIKAYLKSGYFTIVSDEFVEEYGI